MSRPSLPQAQRYNSGFLIKQKRNWQLSRCCAMAGPEKGGLKILSMTRGGASLTSKAKAGPCRLGWLPALLAQRTGANRKACADWQLQDRST